jgi:serine/threonine protein kinase
MSIALGEFWKGLVKSGVTDAAGCKQIAGDYTDANAGTPPSDSLPLASFLVDKGILTEFQAEALLADPPREIRFGNFVVRSGVGPKYLRRWIPVSRVDDRRVGVLFRVAADQIADGRDQWLQAHEEISAEGLQSFDYETQQSWTLVFSELPDGESLTSYLGTGFRLSHRAICEAGISLADALSAMHQRPLVHGAVRADQVWMAIDGRAILLRDPSGPPAGIHDSNQQSWYDGEEDPGLYAAPELSRPDQVCDTATDIYALGCLLFRLASGRYPTEGTTAASLVEAHASMTPAELSEAVKKGEAGDPLYRVLAFAMAKSPASRFSSSAQLSNALKAILPLVSAEAPTQADAEQATATATPNQGSGDASGDSDKTAIAASKAAANSEPPPVVQTTGSTNLNQTQRNASGKTKTKPMDATVATKNGGETVKPDSSEQTSPNAIALGKPEQRTSKIPVVTVAESTESVTTAAGEPIAPDLPSPPPVEGEADQGTSRVRRKKKSKAPLVLGGMCVAVLLLIISLLVPGSPEEKTADKEKERPPMPKVIPPVTNQTKTDKAKPDLKKTEDVAGYNLVDDDRLLYVPPYAADTAKASLGFLPPGPAIVVSLRLSSILESSIGGELIDALSPELSSLIAVIAERAKVPAESIERCGLALHPGKEGWPEVSLAVQLKTPVPASELIEKWQVAASRTADGVTIYAGDSLESDAYYFQGSGKDPISRFAIGSIAKISEVAETEGGGIPLPRSSQTLWNASSDQADIVALFLSPNFLFADGREMLTNSVPELIDPLKEVLQPDVSAMMLAVDFGAEQMFVETRLAASGGTSEAALVRSLRERIAQWPDWADDFIVNTVPDSSWRLLANRLRPMIGFVAERVRFGVSDGMAIANTYLPAQAVPQVTLAAVLALNTPAGATASGGSPKATKPLTVEEMLNRKMSVSFDQESLEFAIDNIKQAFSKDLPSDSKMPKIRILGGDLQLMGITQNQQVRDFKQANIPLRQVLTDLVRRANPDKTATGSKDEKQALIWVVVDDAENPGIKEILVTTRQSAANKYDLPPEFVLE